MAKTSKRLSAKRVIALITAFLFVLSGMPLSSISAQAAVKKPTIAKSATLKVGTSKTIKISKGSYKIVSVKVSSSKKSVATVKASGKAAIKVTGKKAGKATITTKVKAKKGKTSKTFKLTTKVTVKKATKPEPTVDTSKTVNTQDELVAALADSSITQITIGQEATSITIPAGDYSKVDLIVDAPNASITNNGVFKSITIKAIAANTWHEDANGNKIYTDNEKGIRIVLEKGASVESVKIGETTTGEVKIEVAGGSVASIEIAGNEKVDIALSDDATVGTVKVDAAAKVDVTATGTSKIEKVEVTEKAAGTATDKTVVNVKAEGSAEIKEITTSAANSTTNVTANGSADVAKVAVSGNAAASISGTSNKVTEVDIKNADQNASVTVNTTSVKIETKAGTDTEKIINNQSGQALKTEEVQADGTKKETTTATDTTPSSGGGSSTPQQYSIIAPGAITGGSVTASKDKAAAGESVALVIAPADGYVLDGISVSYGSSHAEVQLIPADNGYTFTVPEGDVTVSAAFRALIPVTVADIRTTTGTSIEVTRGQYGKESYISLVTTQVNGIKFTYEKTEDKDGIFGIDENGKVTFWLEADAGTYVGEFTVTAIGDGAYYTGTAEKVITVTVTVKPNALDVLQEALNNKAAESSTYETVSMGEDVTIPEREKLTVPKGVTLKTGSYELTNYGTIENEGIIDGALTGDGKFNGSGTYPKMTLSGTVKTNNKGVLMAAIATTAVTEVDLTGNVTFDSNDSLGAVEEGVEFSYTPDKYSHLYRATSFTIDLCGNTLDLGSKNLQFDRAGVKGKRDYSINSTGGAGTITSSCYYAVLVQGADATNESASGNDEKGDVSLTTDANVTLATTSNGSSATPLLVYVGDQTGVDHTIDLSGVDAETKFVGGKAALGIEWTASNTTWAKDSDNTLSVSNGVTIEMPAGLTNGTVKLCTTGNQDGSDTLGTDAWTPRVVASGNQVFTVHVATSQSATSGSSESTTSGISESGSGTTTP